jgi:uncharacterized membrane protein
MKKKLANAAVVVSAISAMMFAIKENTMLFSGKSLNSIARERCYGISKAGGNACANARHSCAGRATVDRQSDEWKMVAAGTCEKIGGHLKSSDETQL